MGVPMKPRWDVQENHACGKANIDCEQLSRFTFGVFSIEGVQNIVGAAANSRVAFGCGPLLAQLFSNWGFNSRIQNRNDNEYRPGGQARRRAACVDFLVCRRLSSAIEWFTKSVCCQKPAFPREGKAAPQGACPQAART